MGAAQLRAERLILGVYQRLERARWVKLAEGCQGRIQAGHIGPVREDAHQCGIVESPE